MKLFFRPLLILAILSCNVLAYTTGAEAQSSSSVMVSCNGQSSETLVVCPRGTPIADVLTIDELMDIPMGTAYGTPAPVATYGSGSYGGSYTGTTTGTTSVSTLPDKITCDAKGGGYATVKDGENCKACVKSQCRGTCCPFFFTGRNIARCKTTCG